MRKFFAPLAAMFLACFIATTSYAAPKPTLNWGSMINGVCSMDGDLVVNVVMKISNDADSGEAGNYWALDTFNKSVQIWTTDTAGQYCVRVMYLGKFQAVAGQTSPGDPTGTLKLIGTEKGSVEGGYTAIVTGTLNPSPSWPTNGMVGTFDLQCNLSGNCSGAAAADWTQIYFSGGPTTFGYTWWGWIYHGGKFGTWVNATTGNSGNIISQ